MSIWKKINVNNQECTILAQNTNNVWKISLTNLIHLWSEDLQTETIIERCKRLNPLLKIQALNLNEIMEQVLTDIPNNSVETTFNSIALKKNIQGGIFKFEIELTKRSEEVFFAVVTKSLCFSSGELFRRYSLLLELIKKKDEEITEYKAVGAKLIRKHIETKKFTEELFNSGKGREINYFNGFNSVVSLYKEPEKPHSKKEATYSRSLNSPLESGNSNMEDDDRKVSESSETSISNYPGNKSSSSSKSREILKRKREEKRKKAKKAKSVISASFMKPIIKKENRVKIL